MKADFEAWVKNSTDRALEIADLVADGSIGSIGGSIGGSIQKSLLIYHKADGETNMTPMTTYEGFCYITRRCVGKSKVSDAVADEALLCLSRYKVGDASMHKELEENSKTSASIEKAFVLGVKTAEDSEECQTIQTIQKIQKIDCFANPPPEVIQKFWEIALQEKSETFHAEEAGKRAVFKAEEEARCRASKAEEEARCRTSKAEEDARCRTSKAEEDARCRTSKAEEDARCRTSKAEEEAHSRTSKAEEEAKIRLIKSRAFAEQATISASKKRDVTTFKADELEAMERVIAATARLPAVVPPVIVPAVERTESAKRSRRVGVGDNPDFAAYRAAGISDDQIPKDRKEADAWYKRAFTIQLKNRPSTWNNACMRLYEFGARDISGNPVPRAMCCPPVRAPQQ
jgi:hypothetical protein